MTMTSLLRNRFLGQDDGVSTCHVSPLVLNEMDGFSSDRPRQLVMFACSDRMLALDTAFLRHGRLEEHIAVSRPSSKDTEAQLQK